MRPILGRLGFRPARGDKTLLKVDQLAVGDRNAEGSDVGHVDSPVVNCGNPTRIAVNRHVAPPEREREPAGESAGAPPDQATSTPIRRNNGFAGERGFAGASSGCITAASCANA